MSLRPQRHARQTPQGIKRWDVARLIDLSKHLPVREIPINEIAELDELWWFQFPADPEPTPREIADHMRLCAETNLSYPIILCADGRLMDGMHRVVKALLAGHTHIKAVRFPITPPHDLDGPPEA